MDDYYSLLGIDADASVDDIKGAYRVRKDGLDTASDAGKADAAKLNKAWNVLSDPYQRGRYDEQRAIAAESGELGVDDGATPSTNGSASKTSATPRNPRQARQQAAREARLARMKTPTIALPPGTSFPAPKQRIIAMVIDLLVIFVIFLGVGQFGANAVAQSQKPAVVDNVNRLSDQITAQTKIKSDADKRVTADKKANNPTAQAADQKASDAAKANITSLTKQHDDEFAKLNPYLLSGIVLSFLLGLMYLVIPSALSGRTLGKRVQHLKTLREDGSPLGWSSAFRRFGPVVVVTLVLFIALRLGPIGAVVALFGVTAWMRNPNMQGMHDRFAHTIVVSDATD